MDDPTGGCGVYPDLIEASGWNNTRRDGCGGKADLMDASGKKADRMDASGWKADLIEASGNPKEDSEEDSGEGICCLPVRIETSGEYGLGTPGIHPPG